MSALPTLSIFFQHASHVTLLILFPRRILCLRGRGLILQPKPRTGSNSGSSTMAWLSTTLHCSSAFLPVTELRHPIRQWQGDDNNPRQSIAALIKSDMEPALQPIYLQ
ncbi:hypothetical protein C8R45DRAFT_102092 [Mycena sanguinolenta]|nr:hypothetical protein C8R45DRAFT_102092 [Mycena sanguinolenta]